MPQAVLCEAGHNLEDSPLDLHIWLTALWMLTNCKNGISSYEVARACDISQKSGWFVLHCGCGTS